MYCAVKCYIKNYRGSDQHHLLPVLVLVRRQYPVAHTLPFIELHNCFGCFRPGQFYKTSQIEQTPPVDQYRACKKTNKRVVHCYISLTCQLQLCGVEVGVGGFMLQKSRATIERLQTESERTLNIKRKLFLKKTKIEITFKMSKFFKYNLSTCNIMCCTT